MIINAKRKTVVLLMAAFILAIILIGCSEDTTNNDDDSDGEVNLQVAVSILPQATFVEKVAGDLVDVVTVIPPGSSPANYEPTPKEMMALEDSAVYFAIGVPTESANIMPDMVDNTEVDIIELQKNVAEDYEDRYFDTENTQRDPHIWLSPKRVIVMVDTIKEKLSELDPENAEVYTENAEAYIEELSKLDTDINNMFADIDNLNFIIMHPSLGYFADDYGLTMTAIEQDGKTATAKWMQEVIDLAVEQDIHVIFYQQEFDSNQKDTVAEEINGNVVELKPLSPDYIPNLRAMAESFLESE
ncbi:zinc transport system substrate-binding protein [Halolactibacillus halophilus]|uniref:ABC transporter substrate-binding protein n=1 Tax=Halolactibacillus halophilus TaxID=306540 RepID=A0A1I5NP75_9BACI|nr:zinc ABC transporter substrate-binding protein [Halolactibacillus halophilus]GEM01410.1 ABC transporter substrate-binding protein [Halolactibacillus halophilus]SFP23574.1 zinc transport system substrate-binding protein [Halolactibacillus halophilus]